MFAQNDIQKLDDGRFSLGELTLRLEVDEDPMNPREDFDPLGTMICAHRKYKLGDVRATDSDEILRELVGEKVYENHPDPWKVVEDRYVFLPLYLYDHSGLSISASSFHDTWDSGQVGFIYVSKDEVKKKLGRKHWSKKLGEEVIQILRDEVSEYDQYLRGEVYGYVIEDIKGEELDSCWNFFGSDYVLEEGKLMLLQFANNRAVKDSNGQLLFQFEGGIR